MQSYNDYIEPPERVLMSKKLDQVELEPTTFGFPCLRSYQLSYWSDLIHKNIISITDSTVA